MILPLTHERMTVQRLPWVRVGTKSKASEDPDLHHFLARCYLALAKPRDAARFLRRELAIHLRRRNVELVAQTYEELLAAVRELELPAKELSAVGGAMMTAGYETEGAALLQKILAGSAEPLLRLRAGLALAAFHHQQVPHRQGALAPRRDRSARGVLS
jgi:hypothetical protein